LLRLLLVSLDFGFVYLHADVRRAIGAGRGKAEPIQIETDPEDHNDNENQETKDFHDSLQ
jgi:hypothetical protein